MTRIQNLAEEMMIGTMTETEIENLAEIQETKEELVETEMTTEITEETMTETTIEDLAEIREMIEELVETEMTTETAEEVTTEMIEIEEGMILPETEETSTTADIGKEIMTLIGTELKGSAQSYFKTLGESFTAGVKKLAPAINEGLNNLKESIPEIKGTVDAVSSIPTIAKILNTKEEEKKDEGGNK